jgi:hypothetical protein
MWRWRGSSEKPGRLQVALGKHAHWDIRINPVHQRAGHQVVLTEVAPECQLGRDAVTRLRERQQHEDDQHAG